MNLKHDSTFPAPLSIEGFRANVTSFFEVNTPLVFDIEFANVSLVTLVQHADARASLDAADQLMRDGRREDALGKIAIAFLQLVLDFQSRASQAFGASPFDFHKPLRYEAKLQGPVPFLPPPDLSTAPLAGLAEDLTASVQQMQTAVTVLSLGLDYRRFARFEYLTPFVWQAPDTHEYVISRTHDRRAPTPEDCRFCFEFVIECALRFQEFDIETVK